MTVSLLSPVYRPASTQRPWQPPPFPQASYYPDPYSYRDDYAFVYPSADDRLFGPQPVLARVGWGPTLLPSEAHHHETFKSLPPELESPGHRAAFPPMSRALSETDFMSASPQYGPNSPMSSYMNSTPTQRITPGLTLGYDGERQNIYENLIRLFPNNAELVRQVMTRNPRETKPNVLVEALLQEGRASGAFQ